MSQGGLQEIIKTDPNLIKNEIEQFENLVKKRLWDQNFEIYFSYRMRIAVK